MKQALQAILDDLNILHQSGNVRADGESKLSGIRVAVGQLIEQADQAQADADQAAPAPIDVQLAALTEQVGKLVELANHAGAAATPSEATA